MRVQIPRLTGQLAISTAGDAIAAVLGFGAIVLISNALTVGEFGQLNLALAFALIGSQLAGFGTNQPMVRFASAHLCRHETSAADQVIRTAFTLRVGLSLLVAGALALGAEVIATRCFARAELAELLAIAGFGIVTGSTFATLKSALHAHQRFPPAAAGQIAVDGTKLCLTAILAFAIGLSPRVAMAIFVAAPLVGIAVGLSLLRRTLWTRDPFRPSIARRLLDFGKWVVVSNVAVVALHFVGIFLLTTMRGDHDAGIYGLALSLNYGFLVVAGSFASVLLPKTSRFTEACELKQYVHGVLKVGGTCAAAAAPLLLLAYPLIPWVFGERYAAAIPVVMTLAVSSLLMIINTSLRVLLLSLDRPRVLALLDLIRLTATVVGSLLLIPSTGALGPALASVAVNVLVLSVLVVFLFAQMGRGESAVFRSG